MKKWGLVLGSSGSRGSSYIGYIKAFEEAGLKPDFIAGSSMGAVVGACYASGMTIEEMIKEAEELKLMQLISFPFSLPSIRNGAIFNSNKLLKVLKKYLGDKTFNDLNIPFKCVATDLYSGEKVVLDKDKHLATCVTASSSIPGIFSPIELEDYLLVDGGVKCRLPIDEVKEMGAEVVVAIDALGEIRPVKKKFNVFSVIFRTFDVMDSQITAFKDPENNTSMYITPDLGDMQVYSLANIEKAIEIGYEDGKEKVKKLKGLLRE